MLKWAVELAEKAGKLSVEMRKELGLIEIKKDHRDLVTRVDKAVEDLIVSAITEKFPTHGILGEESGTNGVIGEDGYVWVIDPIDGTTNFIHGWGHYGISIALTKHGVGVLGVVYNPATDELFSAEKDGAIHFRSLPWAMRTCYPNIVTKLEDVLFSTTMFWADKDKRDALHPVIIDLAKSTRGIRMNACASLDLSMVAYGKLDAYIMPMLQPWDFAAGATILQCVGGKVTDLYGRDLDFTKPSSIIGSVAGIHQQLVDAFLSFN
jgi:myo-inositol-1(or 4)-monophosphatase